MLQRAFLLSIALVLFFGILTSARITKASSSSSIVKSINNVAFAAGAASDTPAPPPSPAPVGFQNPILNKVLAETRNAYSHGEKPIVIFDLEGTLFDNRSRILQILREYSDAELKKARPQFAQFVSYLTVAQVKYMVADTLRGVGITEEAVLNNAAIFWSQRFFTDEYLKYDTPETSAIRYVRDLYSSGARIVYLTNRDAQRQLVGTARQLRDHGLPIGILNAELLMRPTAQTQDGTFKQQATTY
ncbi:MAG: hypothetical protein JW841_10490, partial [Deltaproteobacteria bacterium]|nr:hypothetical protein [Deltaproteobacteria bacterium]